MSGDAQDAAVALERLRKLAAKAPPDSIDEANGAIETLREHLVRGSATELYAESSNAVSDALSEMSSEIDALSNSVNRATKAIDACADEAKASAEATTRALELLEQTPTKPGLGAVIMSLPGWGRVLVVLALVLATGVVVASVVDGGFALFGVETNAAEGMEHVIEHTDGP